VNIYLIRHGETAWTLTQQHTGTTDIPLTTRGEEDSVRLGKKLKGISFTKILCSPLKRAIATCQHAGLLGQAEINSELVEWNYGEYEGRTSEEIWQTCPGWNIFSHGAPQGESISDISSRADRVLKKILAAGGKVAVFSHGHFLRALTARWLELTVGEGRLFALSPSSLSILGFERANRVIQLWNQLD